MITKLIQKGTQPFKKISRIPSSGKIAPSAEQQEGGGEGSRRRSGDSQQSTKEKSPSAGVGGRGDDDTSSTSNNIDPGSPNSTMARLDAEGRGDDAAADKLPRILRRGEEKNDPSRAAAAAGEGPLSTTSMTHDARLARDGRMMAASNGGPNGGGGNGGPFDVEQSPALVSVDPAASTQPPLSPLSPGSGPAGSSGGQQQQGGGYSGYTGYTGTGERGDAEGDQPPHRMLWARAGAGAPASGAASGQRPPLAPSGTGSAVDQQQQQQQPTSSPPRPSHRGAQPWDDDGQAAMHKASSPSPSGSPGRAKGGGGGRGRGGGAAAAAAAAAGQPPVDYTQPVSLEEAQAIAIAAQQHQGEPQQQQQPGVVVGGGGWNHPQGPPPPVGPPPTPSPSGQSWVPGDPFSPAASPHLGPAMPGAGIMPQHPSGGQRQAGGGGGVGGQQPYQQYNIASVPHLYQPRQSREQQQPQQQQQQQARGYNLQPRPSNRGGHPQQQQQQQQHHHRHLSVPTVGATNWSGGGGSVPSSPARGPYQQPQHHHQQQQQQQQFQPPHHAGPGQGGPAQHPHPHAAAHGAMNPQNQHQQNPHQQSHGPGDRPPPRQNRDSHHPMSASAAASRAPSEILKTLLRKKACLYEPTTSHAIATITWLVGRNLTMSRGYFTRQSLQAGVHTVVAAKIEAGAITRTKVNRCMQIILNSCFHYIIPRVDGSEEDGTAFSVEFRKTAVVGDDDALLDGLPPPWTDLAVPFEIVDQDDDEDAKGGRRGSSGSGAGGKGGGGGGGGSKRSVLLCFNENVRSAQDVFRCHNEFIRDAAHGANLLLTAEEWKLFFSGSSSPTSPRFGPTSSSGKAPSTVSTGTSTPLSSSPASLSPAGIRPVNDGDADAAGIQPPALTLGSAWSTTQAPAPTISLLPRMTGTDVAEADQEDSAREREAQKPPVPTSTGDVLGELTTVDLTKFRTTWCSKRYEHDTSVCGFAHVEVNDGWLRRDPVLYQYKGEMCPDIVPAAEVLGTSNLPSELKGCVFNRCPRGKACDKAHSTEEVDYHPDVYKKALCPSVRRDQDQHLPRQPCKLRDVCPLLHPPGSTQPREQHHHGHGHGHHQQHHHPHGPSRARGAASSPGRGHGASSAPPDRPPSPGAPMIYIEPAPTSDFDAHLQLPGLQAMFRRRCASLFYYYHKCSAGHKVGSYSVFGDNWGLSDD